MTQGPDDLELVDSSPEIVAAKAEAQEKVDSAVVEVADEIARIETEGAGNDMSREQIEGFVARLREVQRKLEALAREYDKGIEAVEGEEAAVKSLAEDLGMGDEVDLSATTSKKAAVHAQREVVTSTQGRVERVLQSSEEKIERIKKEYAYLHEFAGVLHAVKADPNQPGSVDKKNPLVDAVVDFKGYPFNDWLDEKLQDPDSFWQEVTMLEDGIAGEKQSYDLPSNKLRSMLTNLVRERTPIEAQYEKLEEGFAESENLVGLRAKLARLGDDPSYAKLREAANTKIEVTRVEELEAYVAKRKAELDISLGELNGRYKKDLHEFAKGNLTYVYVKNILDSGRVTLAEFCQHIAENIDGHDKDFPYFLLPDDVVKELVEHVDPDEVPGMVKGEHPLIFTRAFRDRDWGLPDVNLSKANEQGPAVDHYLGERKKVSELMQKIDKEAVALKEEIAGKMARVESVLKEKPSTQEPGFIVQPWVASDQESVQAQIDAHDKEIGGIDGLVGKLNGLKVEQEQFSAGVQRQEYPLSRDFYAVKQSESNMSRATHGLTGRRGAHDGYGFRENPLDINVKNATAAFSASFPQLRGLFSNGSRYPFPEFEDYGKAGNRISTKIYELNNLKERFLAEKVKFEKVKEFNIIKASVESFLPDLERELGVIAGEIDTFSKEGQLLVHWAASLRDFEYDRERQRFKIGEGKLEVNTEADIDASGKVSLSRPQKLSPSALKEKMQELKADLSAAKERLLAKKVKLSERVSTLNKGRQSIGQMQYVSHLLNGYEALRRKLDQIIPVVNGIISRIAQGPGSFSIGA